MIHLKLNKKEQQLHYFKREVRALCEPYANKEICKYTRKSFNLTEILK